MKGTMGHTPVAVKLIQSQVAADLEELDHELKMLHVINHPSIVRFIGITFHDDAILLLQEYCSCYLAEYLRASEESRQRRITRR